MVFGVPAISLSCRVLFWGWSSTFLESHCGEALVGCKEAPGQCLHHITPPLHTGVTTGGGRGHSGNPKHSTPPPLLQLQQRNWSQDGREGSGNQG